MKLASIDVRSLAIPFRTAFRHAAAARSATQIIWVKARCEDGVEGFGEGCPRPYVTGESVAGALAFIAARRGEWLRAIRDVASLREWVTRHRVDIDAHPAAFAAVELALLDLIGKAQRRPIEALLGLPPLAGRFQYTAVLGDASAAPFAAQLDRYLRAGFRRFKIKLVAESARDRPKIDALVRAGVAPSAIRADANNCWASDKDAIGSLRELGFQFAAVEEPLRPGDFTGMRRVATSLATPIVLDESVTRIAQMAALAGDSARWIVNLRVSKMGGLLRALEAVDAARANGLRLVVGAHVGETSVLTRAALTVAAYARELVVAQEGAFGTHLLAHDVSEPPLMFGSEGVLDADALDFARAPGLGLAIRER